MYSETRLKWIRAEAATLQVPEVSGAIREMEFDEMWHFIGSKKNKKWIIKALDRAIEHYLFLSKYSGAS